jgi:phosphatidate phosphatase LPIN
MQPHDLPITPPGSAAAGNPNKNYAKTLRLTSDQLKALDLSPGENLMSFTVNRATCQAYMYLWRHDVPVVISDIDGTITKSDALGHILNMVGRDWTHVGVAKLYCDIVANGYNIMYLTSRSVGQSDTTRTYLKSVAQDGYRLPRGPTILSPDRTMAALRREVYLRKPEVFKMATLRDIRQLYGGDRKPFYAGFGNRLTDQMSYRTVDVPRTRIFTINSSAEVVLDLLSLNRLKMTYMNINEVVDHYFPPVSTLIKDGGEEFTDFKFWRAPLLDLDEFTASESEEASMYGDDGEGDAEEGDMEDDDDDEVGEGLADSYMTRDGEGSIVSVYSEDMDDQMMDSMMEDYADADEEYGGDEDDGVAEEEGEAEANEEGELDELEESTGVLERMTTRERMLVKDHGAELITGVKHLSLEKDISE